MTTTPQWISYGLGGDGGAAGVTSLNTLTGAVTIAAGTGIQVAESGGDTITISSTSAGDVTLGAFGSSPNANGASISGSQVLTLQPASASFPGGVSTTTQTFAGLKTFDNGLLTNSIDSEALNDTLSIGGTSAATINIGRSGATINIIGTTLYENVSQLQVADPLITLNKGGGVGSAANSGLELEENNVITGYIETSSDRNSWQFKAPNTAGIVTLTPGISGFTIDQASHYPVTLGAVGSSPNANGASLSTQVLTLQPADGTNPGVLTAGTQTIGGNKTFSGTITTALTASRALATGASSELAVSATTATQLGYLSGATGTTGTNLLVFNTSPTFAGTITTALTASRAIVSNASSQLAVSATTDTQVGYLSGTTGTTGTNLLVLGTSPTITTPTFTTSATGPLFIGGTGTTSTLTLRSTSGTGTTGSDIIFQSGTNGSVEIARMSFAGSLMVGTTSTTARLDVRQNQAANTFVDFYNTTNGGGFVQRFIVRNIADSGTTSADIAKLTGGAWVFNNNDTNSANYTSFGVGGTERFKIDSAGNLLTPNIHNNASPPTNTLAVLSSGTYTPTLSGGSNVQSSTVRLARYLRVGNVVTVAGQVEIDPTATGVTSFQLSLPIASAIAQVYEVSGAAIWDIEGVRVYGNTTNDTAEFLFTATFSTTASLAYTYTYLVQ